MKEHHQKLFSEETKVDHWESVYDRKDFWGYCYRARMNQTFNWLDKSDLDQNSVILDAGCGAGILTHKVAERGYKILGMDFSFNMLEKAKSSNERYQLIYPEYLQGDIESLPFQDSSFDMIICLGVITYLASEKKTLQELSRILKPNGTLILSFLNKAHLKNYLDVSLFLKRRIQKIVRIRRPSENYTSEQTAKKEEEKKDVVLKRYFAPKLRKSLRQHGLKVSEYTTVPFGLLTFLGREFSPKNINIKLTMFIEKFTKIPYVGPLGGMCIFRVTKMEAGGFNENQ